MEKPIKMNDFGPPIFGNIQVDLVELIFLYGIMEVDLLAFWFGTLASLRHPFSMSVIIGKQNDLTKLEMPKTRRMPSSKLPDCLVREHQA